MTVPFDYLWQFNVHHLKGKQYIRNARRMKTGRKKRDRRNECDDAAVKTKWWCYYYLLHTRVYARFTRARRFFDFNKGYTVLYVPLPTTLYTDDKWQYIYIKKLSTCNFLLRFGAFAESILESSRQSFNVTHSAGSSRRSSLRFFAPVIWTSLRGWVAARRARWLLDVIRSTPTPVHVGCMHVFNSNEKKENDRCRG